MAFLPDGHPPFPRPRYLANRLLAGFLAAAFRIFVTFISPPALPLAVTLSRLSPSLPASSRYTESGRILLSLPSGHPPAITNSPP
jgi:hypothetical protein